MERKKKSRPAAVVPKASPDMPARQRILRAAFTLFMNQGYQRTSTLHIATRAKVSKRELYALFDDKHAMLVACIKEHAEQMRMPLSLSPARDRDALATTLSAFGSAFLRCLCDPNVLALHRFAIAESSSAPEIAKALDEHGRLATRIALIGFLQDAQANGLVGAADMSVAAERFFALVWGGLQLRLLLSVVDAPKPAEIEKRAREASATLLSLYPAPAGAGRDSGG